MLKRYAIWWMLLQLSTCENAKGTGLFKCPSEFINHEELFDSIIQDNKAKNRNINLQSPRTQDVAVAINMETFFHINEIDSTIKIHLELVTLWSDPRVGFECGNVSSVWVGKERVVGSVWTPPISIISALSVVKPHTPSPSAFATISNTGEIYLSEGMIVQTPCRIDLTLFPFDDMHCDIEVAMLPHPHLHLHWHFPSTQRPHPSQDVTIKRLHNYLTSHSVESCRVVEKKGERERSVLVCSVGFRRHYGFFVLQAFIPNIITVLVSSLSFLLCPKTAVPARATLSISSLLAIVLMYGNVAQSIPKVGYLRAIDLWMIFCVLFVFFTLVQFAFGQALFRRHLRIRILKGELKSKAEDESQIKWAKCDKISFYAFLIVFFVFCLVFFIIIKTYAQ